MVLWLCNLGFEHDTSLLLLLLLHQGMQPNLWTCMPNIVEISNIVNGNFKTLSNKNRYLFSWTEKLKQQESQGHLFLAWLWVEMTWSQNAVKLVKSLLQDLQRWIWLPELSYTNSWQLRMSFWESDSFSWSLDKLLRAGIGGLIKPFNSCFEDSDALRSIWVDCSSVPIRFESTLFVNQLALFTLRSLDCESFLVCIGQPGLFWTQYKGMTEPLLILNRDQLFLSFGWSEGSRLKFALVAGTSFWHATLQALVGEHSFDLLSATLTEHIVIFFMQLSGPLNIINLLLFKAAPFSWSVFVALGPLWTAWPSVASHVPDSFSLFCILMRMRFLLVTFELWIFKSKIKS